jgi:alanyl-tRNA synthetase
MDVNQIRRRFVDFFVTNDHVHRPSASLIPVDPTLLLTNAGMVPFKPYFLGDEPAPFKRAVTVQKCARTIDIDIIGTTHRHLSFFEMLGNFSFGDYFKAEAIPWAYELVTTGFGLDPERLWFTVYETDEEAAAIWVDQVGVPASRVQRGGRDNFWQMGVPGPCGPCSEIFWDKGDAFGEAGGPIGGSEERYVEIWNLVFMQNIQDEPYHVIGDLPQKSIDTGMGLERMAAVLQGKETVFEVDTIWPVLQAGASFTKTAYGESPLSDVSLRIIADHGRSMTFLIADGVVPSNEGRGYVLRRLLRRAVRHAWQLGGDGLITPALVKATVEVAGDWYPELRFRQDLIAEVVSREETRFRRTLESGHQLLGGEMEGLSEGAALSGEVAFKLHDTYGFPIELTREIAAERGVAVDQAGFEAAMEEQRARARRAWRGADEAAVAELYRRVLDETGLTEFTGYGEEAGTGRILAILRSGEQVERADHGQEVEVFLDRTPFYGESGGQVGDTGSITTETGSLAVSDTQHAVAGLHGHRARVLSGHIQVGQDAVLQIDSPRRDRIRKSHTGTHVLHWSLRQVLGNHAHQAGSLVEAGRLRFDFSHFSAVAPEELSEIEVLANGRLIAGEPVTTTITSREEAERMGALAFFGDKYGERVRVVKVGEFSIEFCGGTHTHTAGQVGPLVVMGESSIGSNLRRVEALTGEDAYRHLVGMRAKLGEVGQLLRAPSLEVPGRVRSLLERLEDLDQELSAYRMRERSSIAEQVVAEQSEVVGSGRLVTSERPDLSPEQLRLLALSIRERIARGVVVMGSTHDGKAGLVAAVTKDLVAEGVSAAQILRSAAQILGGGGSRDPELSQAGGPKGELLGKALDVARETATQAMAAR